MTSVRRSVLLQFSPSIDVAEGEKPLRSQLSASVQTGSNLWIVSDETASLERLTAVDAQGFTYGAHTTFALRNYVDLPAGFDDEVDLEGLAWSEPYLWVIGSHSLRRRRARQLPGQEWKEIARLADVDEQINRYMLARIPLQKDSNGDWTPQKECPDPANPGKMLTSARLDGAGFKSELMKALKGDPHLDAYLTIPSKDNGMDIEGLAAAGNRLFVGLRGPVLRGWAVVLEIRPEEIKAKGGKKGKKGKKKAGGPLLRLGPVGERGEKYRKHFLDLGGLGVRDLSIHGEDMLILAGPTMLLDGPVHVYRWLGAMVRELPGLGWRDDVPHLMALPYGQGATAGHDHPEGITAFSAPGLPPALLVVYDAPVQERLEGELAVRADLFAVPSWGKTASPPASRAASSADAAPLATPRAPRRASRTSAPSGDILQEIRVSGALPDAPSTAPATDGTAATS